MNYKRLPLGERDHRFIMMFATRSSTAWDIYERLKEPPGHHSVEYPNVLGRIKQLVKMGLLEREEGTLKRNAIRYRLTSRGLVERLLIRPVIEDLVQDVSMWDRYRDNVILQAILYQYFEPNTIKKFSESEYRFGFNRFEQYLRNCCEIILEEGPREMTFEQNGKYYKYHFSDEQFRITRAVNMDVALEQEIKKFVHLLVTEINSSYINNEDKHIYVLPAKELANDKKFIAVAKKVKTKLETGYAKLMSLIESN